MTFRPSLVNDTSDWNSSSVDDEDEDEPDGSGLGVAHLLLWCGGGAGTRPALPVPFGVLVQTEMIPLGENQARFKELISHIWGYAPHLWLI
jgi:hypothetical protein